MKTIDEFHRQGIKGKHIENREHGIPKLLSRFESRLCSFAGITDDNIRFVVLNNVFGIGDHFVEIANRFILRVHDVLSLLITEICTRNMKRLAISTKWTLMPK